MDLVRRLNRSQTAVSDLRRREREKDSGDGLRSRSESDGGQCWTEMRSAMAARRIVEEKREKVHEEMKKRGLRVVTVENDGSCGEDGGGRMVVVRGKWKSGFCKWHAEKKGRRGV